jgi:uncharacterized protein
VKIDLLKLEGSQPFDEELAVEPQRLDNELVTGPMTVRLEGEVRPHGDYFTVSGRSSTTGMLACSRCLEGVEWTDSDDFTVRYRLSPPSENAEEEVGLAEGDLEVAYLVDGALHLEELAAEQILLALPMRFVCDESCAGLCPQCGANQNREDACSCEPETDPRWHALADLVDHRNNS